MIEPSSIKRIDDPQHLEKIRALEQELGIVLLALEPRFYPATLSKEQQERLRALERELSVVLVAYEPAYVIRAPLQEEEIDPTGD